MTGAERTSIIEALGPAVMSVVDRIDSAPEPGAWRPLALAVAASLGDLLRVHAPSRAIFAAIVRRASVACDAMVTGRIGNWDFSNG